MTDSIEKQEQRSSLAEGFGRVSSARSTGIGSELSTMTKIKLELIIAAAISLLIGIGVGAIVVHLFTGMTSGLQGQWHQFVRF